MLKYHSILCLLIKEMTPQSFVVLYSCIRLYYMPLSLISPVRFMVKPRLSGGVFISRCERREKLSDYIHLYRYAPGNCLIDDAVPFGEFGKTL